MAVLYQGDKKKKETQHKSPLTNHGGWDPILPRIPQSKKQDKGQEADPTEVSSYMTEVLFFPGHRAGHLRDEEEANQVQ